MGGEGRNSKQSVLALTILILYAWIELFNFFFLLHIFLVLRWLFPRAMSSWF